MATKCESTNCFEETVHTCVQSQLISQLLESIPEMVNLLLKCFTKKHIENFKLNSDLDRNNFLIAKQYFCSVIRSLLSPFLFFTKLGMNLDQNFYEFLYDWIDNLLSLMIKIGFKKFFDIVKYNLTTYLLIKSNKLLFDHIISNSFCKRTDEKTLQLIVNSTLRINLLPCRFNYIIRQGKNDIFKGKLKSYDLLYSLNQSKKGMSILPDCVLDQNLKKFKTLSSSDPVDLGYNPNQLSYPALICAVDLIFGNKKFDWKEEYTKVPPASASNQFSRKDDGQIGHFYDYIKTYDKRMDTENFLQYKNYIPEFQDYCRWSRNEEANIFILTEPNKFRFINVNSTSDQFGPKALQEYMLNCWKNSKYSTMSISHQVDENFLIEKGIFNALDSDLILKSVDYSSATDNIYPDVSMTILNLILLRTTSFEEGEFSEYDKFIRGALNSIEMKNFCYTHKSEGKWVQGTYSKDLNMMINGIYRPGEIIKEHWQQTMGQTQGTILSFPLLCVLNLATFIHTKFPNLMLKTKIVDDYLYNTSSKKPALRYLNNNGNDIDEFFSQDIANAISFLVINGDDAVIGLTPKESKRHDLYSSYYGLKINDLKTYESYNYININSVSFTLGFDKILNHRTIKTVENLNQSLLFNNRIKKDGGLMSINDIGDCYRELFNQSGSYLALSVFKSYHKNLIDQLLKEQFTNIRKEHKLYMICQYDLPLQYGGLNLKLFQTKIVPSKYIQEMSYQIYCKALYSLNFKDITTRIEQKRKKTKQYGDENYFSSVCESIKFCSVVLTRNYISELVHKDFFVDNAYISNPPCPDQPQVVSYAIKYYDLVDRVFMDCLEFLVKGCPDLDTIRYFENQTSDKAKIFSLNNFIFNNRPKYDGIDLDLMDGDFQIYSLRDILLPFSQDIIDKNVLFINNDINNN